MRPKRILAFLMILTLCITAMPALAEEGKTVTLTESWEFTTGFYPVLTSANSSNLGITYWSRNFYDTLVAYDPDGKIAGNLATDWAVSGDGLTYTFTLRDGVRFSDGTPLTASLVKRSFEVAIESLGQFNGSYGRLTSIIASMDAPDDATFILRLSQPYYGTLNDLTMCNPLGIVNFSGVADDADIYALCQNQTLGTGPYLYAGDFDGSTYTFVRNPYYWGETLQIEGFRIKVIADNDSKVLALRSGEIDAILGTTRMSYDAYNELQQDPAYGTVINTRATLTRYLGLNLSQPPFDDIRVRRAINYALDRETLCEAVFQGIEMPAYTLFARDRPNCDVEATTYAYDLQKANELMDEAGWVDADGDGIREKDGQALTFNLVYTTDNGSLDDAVSAIAAELKAIGFQLTPQGTDMLSWFGAVGSGEYGVTLYQTYGGAYDPTTVMSNMNPAVSSDPVAVQVATGLSGSVALLTELDGTSDARRVSAIYQEILTGIADQALYAPLTYTREFGAWNSAVIAGYAFTYDSQYVLVANLELI